MDGIEDSMPEARSEAKDYNEPGEGEEDEDEDEDEGAGTGEGEGEGEDEGKGEDKGDGDGNGKGEGKGKSEGDGNGDGEGDDDQSHHGHSHIGNDGFQYNRQGPGDIFVNSEPQDMIQDDIQDAHDSDMNGDQSGFHGHGKPDF
jgi:hypothetical protein